MHRLEAIQAALQPPNCQQAEGLQLEESSFGLRVKNLDGKTLRLLLEFLEVLGSKDPVELQHFSDTKIPFDLCDLFELFCKF